MNNEINDVEKNGKNNVNKVLIVLLIISLLIIAGLVVYIIFDKKDNSSVSNNTTNVVIPETTTIISKPNVREVIHLQENVKETIKVNDKNIEIIYSNISGDWGQTKTIVNNKEELSSSGHSTYDRYVYIVIGNDNKEYAVLVSEWSQGGTGYYDLIIYNDNAEKIYNYSYNDFKFNDCTPMMIDDDKPVSFQNGKIFVYDPVEGETYNGEINKVIEKELVISNNTVLVRENGIKSAKVSITCSC